MVAINVRSNIKDISKKLTEFAYKQVPFATATALTSLAKLVKQGEVDALKATLKNPSPFTLNSIKVAAARKLAVRLYWMLRTEKPYPEIVRIESSPRVALVGAS